MPTPLGRQTIRALGIHGLIREAEVDSTLVPEGAVTETINVNFDRKGAVTSRPGLTAIGSTVSAGNPCIGMHNIQSNTAIVAFVTSGSTTIYERQGSSWAQIGKGVGSGVVRFVDFANRTVMFGGSENSIRVFAGSNFSGNSGNPINPDDLWYVNGTGVGGYIRPQYGEVFKARAYLAGDTNYVPFNSRLWFSSVISSSGNITWDPPTDYVDINPADGEGITALKRFSLELLVFKPNYTYRFRTTSVDPDPLIKVGTRSQESVIEGKAGCYFHHDTGFYRYSGGYPVEISRPISDVVKAIPFGNYDDIVSWKDEDHIYWSVGDLTIPETKGSSLWTNVVLRYTESSEVWTVYSYSNEIRRGGPFVTSTSSSIMVGLDSGVVAEFNKGLVDLGEPIKYRMITKWYEWEGIENEKVINRMIAICEKGMGSQVMYQVNDFEDWVTLTPDLNKLITYFNKPTKKFNRIRFKFTGLNSSEALVFKGLEILEGLNNGIIYG